MAKTKKKAVPDAKRCVAIQKKGTRCKLRKAKGSKFCFNHKGGKGTKKKGNPGKKKRKSNPKKKRSNPGGRRMGGKKKAKKSNKPKLPSLSKSVTVVGGVITITGLGAAQVDDLVGALSGVGGGVAITGATIVGVVVGLKIAAHMSPNWFGPKYRAFLKTWGFRP